MPAYSDIRPASQDTSDACRGGGNTWETDGLYVLCAYGQDECSERNNGDIDPRHVEAAGKQNAASPAESPLLTNDAHQYPCGRRAHRPEVTPNPWVNQQAVCEYPVHFEEQMLDAAGAKIQEPPAAVGRGMDGRMSE